MDSVSKDPWSYRLEDSAVACGARGLGFYTSNIQLFFPRGVKDEKWSEKNKMALPSVSILHEVMVQAMTSLGDFSISARFREKFNGYQLRRLPDVGKKFWVFLARYKFFKLLEQLCVFVPNQQLATKACG